MIACKTHIAIGTAAQDTSKGHGALTDPELLKMREKCISGATNHLIFPNRLKSSGNKQVSRDIMHSKDGSLS